MDREGGKEKDRQKGPSRAVRNGGERRKERCGGQRVGLESEGARRERVGQFPCREGQRGGRGCSGYRGRYHDTRRVEKT